MQAGFCGTPSTLPAGGREWSEDTAMLWGVLEPGQYRLSYEAGTTFETEGTASGKFTVAAPELCALPLAPTPKPEGSEPPAVTDTPAPSENPEPTVGPSEAPTPTAPPGCTSARESANS